MSGVIRPRSTPLNSSTLPAAMLQGYASMSERPMNARDRLFEDYCTHCSVAMARRYKGLEPTPSIRSSVISHGRWQ